MDKHFLTPLFSPESIVVFAGQPDEPGGQTPQARALTDNLRAQRYTGTLVFVDIHTSGTLADLAQTKADLAIIALPAQDLSAALELAGRMACKAALVIASGISVAQAAELHKIARREGMHLLGPNGLGFQRPQLQLNACNCGVLARKGSLALVSQSGALTASMLDWAANNAVGFSSVVSLGAHSAVDIAQVLDFLANDAQTHSIIVYLEGISNARRFMSALRSAANAKPVVVLRPAAGPLAMRRRKRTAAPSSAATMSLIPPCAGPARCVCARLYSYSPPPSAWPRATGRWASAWPSSAMAAGPACWPPIG